MKRGYTDTSYGQVHYRIGGSGPPVLLLHSTARSSWEYETIMPFLVPKCTAIAMDTPGYGQSDKPPRPFSIEDYARVVVAFLNALGVGKVTVVGHHTGATIAGELAVAYPERVSGLVLSGYPLYTDEEARRLLSGSGAGIPGGGPFPDEIKEDGSHLLEMWRLVKETRKPPLRSLAELHAMVMSQLEGASSRRQTFEAVWRYDAPSRLPLITCPVIVVDPTGDALSGRGAEVGRLIPGSQVVSVETGNYLPHNDPEKLACVVERLL